MIFRMSTFLDFVPCVFFFLPTVGSWRTKRPGWRLDCVKSGASPTENLHLSVSYAKITARTARRLLSDLSAAHGRKGRVKKQEGGRNYRLHGISLSISMENVAQRKAGFGRPGAGGMRGQLTWQDYFWKCLSDPSHTCGEAAHPQENKRGHLVGNVGHSARLRPDWFRLTTKPQDAGPSNPGQSLQFVVFATAGMRTAAVNIFILICQTSSYSPVFSASHPDFPDVRDINIKQREGRLSPEEKEAHLGSVRHKSSHPLASLRWRRTGTAQRLGCLFDAIIQDPQDHKCSNYMCRLC